MNLIIRHEKDYEHSRVEEVARNAFWNLYFPGAHEHFLIHKIRKHEDYIPELSFVIEVDGQIEGSIYYTKSHVLLANGEVLGTITFGPVSISPNLHRQGLGRKLVSHSIALAKRYGYLGILTLGYPYHYKPYGFVGAKKYNICMPDGKYYKGLLALPLNDYDFNNIAGQAIFSDVFEVHNDDVDIFDSKFPFKAKKEQASQREYELACQELDD